MFLSLREESKLKLSQRSRAFQPFDPSASDDKQFYRDEERNKAKSRPASHIPTLLGLVAVGLVNVSSFGSTRAVSSSPTACSLR
jgi:hypothetical protein